MIRRLPWTVFAVICLNGCAGAVPMRPGAETIRIADTAPERDFVGEIQGVHGHGCGLLGLRGNREGALADLRNKALAQHADVLVIQRETPPHDSGNCTHNEFVIEARAYAYRSAPPPAAGSTGDAPPLRSIVRAPPPPGVTATTGAEVATAQQPARQGNASAKDPQMPGLILQFAIEDVGPLNTPTVQAERSTGECREERGYWSQVGAGSSDASVLVFGGAGQLIRVEGVPGEECILHGVDAPGCVPTKAPPPIPLHYAGSQLVRFEGDRGMTVELSYDQQGRLARVSRDRPGYQLGTRDVSHQYFRYDSLGHIQASASDSGGDGTLEQSGVWEGRYDDHGRIIALTMRGDLAGIYSLGASVVVEYDYDAAGRVHAVRHSIPQPTTEGTVNRSSDTTYAYDGQGRLETIKQCTGDAACVESKFQYAANGDLTLVGASSSSQGREEEDGRFAKYGPGCRLELLPPDPTHIEPLPNEFLAVGRPELGAPVLRITARKGNKASRKPL